MDSCQVNVKEGISWHSVARRERVSFGASSEKERGKERKKKKREEEKHRPPRLFSLKSIYLKWRKKEEKRREKKRERGKERRGKGADKHTGNCPAAQ